jgi:hypothetical protein
MFVEFHKFHELRASFLGLHIAHASTAATTQLQVGPNDLQDCSKSQRSWSGADGGWKREPEAEAACKAYGSRAEFGRTLENGLGFENHVETFQMDPDGW